MRKADVQNIGSVISELIQEYRLGGKFDEAKLCSAWKQMMGPSIANYTETMYLKRQCFYIKLKSSVLREELSYGKEKMVAGLNEIMGKPTIKEIRFV
ncbi:MAG: putative nucleic acid-binding Zn ribbon protein [Flavobacteriales bacterium]|jgi:predicted nucleic acid-binding Zn ribbon protein